MHPETKKIVKKTRLISKQYYCDSGLTQHRKKTQKWLVEDQEYKIANEELSKTTSVIDYLEVLNRYDRVIWLTKTSKKWRRSNFRVYCLRKKTLDKFVNRVIGDTKTLGPFHLAFGDAKFATTGRCEHYGSPYLKLRKVMQQRAGSINFSLVEEYNTSKVCHRCFQPLMKVKVPVKEKQNVDKEKKDQDRLEGEENTLKRRRKAPEMKTLRGLQRCCSEKSNNINNAECPIGGAFIDRDSNAATNIALKYIWEIKLEPDPPNNFTNLMKDTRLNPPRSFILPTSRASCRLGTNKDVARTSVQDGRLFPFGGKREK